MSYSHNQRSKVIRILKKFYGSNWYTHFRLRVDNIMRERLGPPTGTLEDIIALRKVNNA